MRRILLSCASLAVLMVPAAASAGGLGQARSKPGYLVVRKAVGDGARPIVTLIVRGFVLGRVSGNHEAQIDIYHLPSPRSDVRPHANGFHMKQRSVQWRGRVPGTEYSGSGFRFRAIGGSYRVVVRGAGVYLFAGGQGNVRLQGSRFDRQTDGTYSLDGATPRSLPTRSLQLRLGGG
jgi:hypothetical protein